jgi:hypothetical protein
VVASRTCLDTATTERGREGFPAITVAVENGASQEQGKDRNQSQEQYAWSHHAGPTQLAQNGFVTGCHK